MFRMTVPAAVRRSSEHSASTRLRSLLSKLLSALCTYAIPQEARSRGVGRYHRRHGGVKSEVVRHSADTRLVRDMGAKTLRVNSRRAGSDDEDFE